jgi:serine/threonine protein kinase/Tol biopolymer transport system component
MPPSSVIGRWPAPGYAGNWNRLLFPRVRDFVSIVRVNLWNFSKIGKLSMNEVNHWQRVKNLFHAAVDLPRAEREVFLSDACGADNDLRSEVESLIASHEKDGSFIDSPAYEAAAQLIVNEKEQLRPGQSIGSFEIISFISRGGMGEVYLAQDRRLSRKVALKILPVTFTKDIDRLGRFEQEARAASALNHPNIITIYEILKANSTHVIATEFVEGETLRQRLSHTALSLNQSLQIAIQIADALAAAHQAGIVHRDIKPENVMLRPDGYVKVLDFGLAKLAEQTSSAVAAEAPTKQVRTGSGMVLGTAGYMSPEQARGKTVDGRSDIFSLGAVIYEMTTQHKPFDGETPSDVLASILKTEPPPVSQFFSDAPPELTRIVAKTLRKDREERYQVIGDLLLDLKTLRQELEFQARLGQSAASGAGVATVAAAATQSATTLDTAEPHGAVTTISQALSVELKRHPTRLVISLAIVAIVLIAGGTGLYALLNRTPRRTHFQSSTIARITNSGKVIDARLSHDGQYLIYCLSDAGKQSIWIRQVSTANDKLVVSPAPMGLFGITISPDDHDLYYVVKQNFDAGTLYRTPILGGTSVKLLDRIDCPVTLAPDGKRMAFVRASYPTENESALVVANVDGSNQQALAVRKKPERFAPIFFTGPSWSPDGKLIAASVLTQATTEFDAARSEVIAFPVAGGPAIKLNRDPWPFSAQVQWLPDITGLLVVAGDNGGTGAKIWLLSYPEGTSKQITNDLDQHRTIGLTADGSKFVNIVGTGLVSIWTAPDGDASRAVQIPVGNIGAFSGLGNSLTWTPDGQIVFASADGNEIDLWITDASGANRRPLTSNAGINVNPVVSPDGRYIIFSSTRTGQPNIWRIQIDGSNPKQLTNGLGDSRPVISPDGKWVVYSRLMPTRPTLWKVSIDGGEPVEVTHRAATSPMISPDGEFIAFLYTDSPDPLTPPNRIAIMPFDGGEAIKTFEFQPATTVVTVAQWSNDGKSILYTTNTNNLTNIWAQPIDGGAPKQVTDFKELYMTGFAWSRDGKQLACSRSNYTRDAVIVSETK